jgi:hypothetical protein
MQKHVFLIAGLVVCTVLAAAGCVASAPPSAQVQQVTTAILPASPSSLEPFSLAPADLPPGFTLTESREKTTADVSSLALDLGWESGYVVHYVSSTNGDGGTTDIVQNLAVYPEKNLPDVISAVVRQETSAEGYVFANLSLPMTGENSRAFRATAVNTMTTQVTGNVPLGTTGSAASTASQNFVEGIFARGNYLDVIRISGPSPDYGLLVNLSVTAYNRLP